MHKFLHKMVRACILQLHVCSGWFTTHAIRWRRSVREHFSYLKCYSTELQCLLALSEEQGLPNVLYSSAMVATPYGMFRPLLN